MSETVTPLAIAAVNRILNGHGDEKHGDEWKTRADGLDYAALHRHLRQAEKGKTLDVESGEHPLAHVISRAALILERRLRNGG